VLIAVGALLGGWRRGNGDRHRHRGGGHRDQDGDGDGGGKPGHGDRDGDAHGHEGEGKAAAELPPDTQRNTRWRCPPSCDHGAHRRKGNVQEARTESQSLAERLLTEAYDFVLGGWCQGAAALDEAGRPIEPSSAFARRWSALGAVERAWRRSDAPPEAARAAFEEAKLALTAAVNDVPQPWNDEPGRHQSDVLSALAEAVSLLAVPKPRHVHALERMLDDVDSVAPRWSEAAARSPSLAGETAPEA
jgi:hypothetical protein